MSCLWASSDPCSPRPPRCVELVRGGGFAAICLAVLTGCGAGEGARPPSTQIDPEFEGPSFYESDEEGGAVGSPPSHGAVDGLVDGPSSPAMAVGARDACVTDEEEAKLVTVPVDIILLLDNSGSMSDELEAVEANINVNFASILTGSDVDYRVILISRHRHAPRGESEESSTSICVSSPLSGLRDCTAAAEPVLSERFFQYSTKLESTDSFDVMLDTYTSPFSGSEREDKYDNAPLGWSQWLRPSAKKVFLEMTDDNADMPIDTLLEQLVTMAPEHFGSDPSRLNFVFHSIVGLAEKSEPTEAYFPDEPIQTATCTGNSNVVLNAGETYQELSSSPVPVHFGQAPTFDVCQADARAGAGFFS
jgi:hypothetical protein